MTRTLIVLVLVVVLLLVLVWAMQRRLIYFPTGGPAGAPPELAGPIDAVTITTGDAVVLGAWFLPAAGTARATVLVCNGNAGNRSHRLPFAMALRRLGAQVLLFDYRGYGGNPGSPSETGLAADARAAHAYLAARPGVDPARVIYFGESLGAAVAAGLAETHPPAALILRSPFASLAEIGRYHYPVLPVRWLLRDRYDVISSVARVRVPTLVIAGTRDGIVPEDQSRRVFEAAAGPKEFVRVPGADHNDEALFTGEVMMAAIARALESRPPR